MRLRIIICICAAGFLVGCSPTRYVPQGKLLLQNIPVVKGAQTLDTEEIITTQPNKRILLPKAYLSFYNLGRIMQEDSSKLVNFIRKVPFVGTVYKGTSKWLATGIGEPPVLIDTANIIRDSLNLINTYAANGFFDTQVSYQIDTIRGLTKDRKGNITYFLTEGKAFYINKLRWDIPQAYVAMLIRNSQNKSSVKSGDRLSYGSLTRERARVANLLRENGYFTFSPSLITFELDTLRKQTIPDTTQLPNLESRNTLDSTRKWVDVIMRIDTPPPSYRIREVFIDLTSSRDSSTAFTNQVKLRGDELSEEQRAQLGISKKILDQDKAITFLVSPSLLSKVNFNFLADRIYLKEGEVYAQSKARRTLNRLQELTMLQYAIINYDVIDSLQLIDVTIEARTAALYQFKAGFEAYNNNTNSANFSPVLGASLGIRDKNTFGRAEVLDASVSGDVGLYPINEVEQDFFWQVDGQLDLTVPRFLLPFPKSWLPDNYQNLSGYRPSTTLSLNLGRQQLEQYDQLETSFSIAYAWFNRKNSQQERTQVSWRLDLTNITIKDQVFAEEVARLPEGARRSFIPRFSSPLSIIYTNSDYGTSRVLPTSFFQLNVETGGHIPRLLETVLASDTNSQDNFLTFDSNSELTFGQYVKASVEQKLAFPLSTKSTLILRGILGLSAPIGPTAVLPPEARFYSGGTNGMRGWLSKTLGPGTFPLRQIQDPDAAVNLSSLFALGGEYLLEANVEYRLDFWEYIELAIFTDAGNVWFHNGPGVKDALGDIEDQTTFRRENLAIAWDIGVGMRLDFNFLILRLDLAQQLYAPDLKNDPIRKGWVIRDLKDFGGQRLQFNLGIGYPF